MNALHMYVHSIPSTQNPKLINLDKKKEEVKTTIVHKPGKSCCYVCVISSFATNLPQFTYLKCVRSECMASIDQMHTAQ